MGEWLAYRNFVGTSLRGIYFFTFLFGPSWPLVAPLGHIKLHGQDGSSGFHKWIFKLLLFVVFSDFPHSAGIIIQYLV